MHHFHPQMLNSFALLLLRRHCCLWNSFDERVVVVQILLVHCHEDSAVVAAELVLKEEIELHQLLLMDVWNEWTEQFDYQQTAVTSLLKKVKKVPSATMTVNWFTYMVVVGSAESYQLLAGPERHSCLLLLPNDHEPDVQRRLL
jgi:hypothetical protein